jgi:FemAB-related protein (PEP-CTERM system-associated)
MAIILDDIKAAVANDSLQIMPLADGGQEWLDYLLTNDSADICQHPAWGDIFRKTFGRDSLLIVHRTEGKIDGGLPLILFNKRLDRYFARRSMISMPFLNYGGLLYDNDEACDQILKACRQIVQSQNYDYLEMRHTARGIGDLADRSFKRRITFRLNIDRPLEEIHKGFKKQLRTRLRKADNQGLEYYQGQDRLNDFYHLFSMAQQELGTPVMPKRFFALVLEYLSEHAEMMIAYKDNQPVGGKLVLKFNNRATMTWGCYPIRYKHLIANYYLTWELIQQLAQGKIKLIDFGRSPLDSGGHKYKSNWGPEEIPIYTEYIAANPDNIPNLKPDSGHYNKAIAIWKKLPLGITRIVGPRLAGYFP